jgi:hypothetical protein
VRCRGWRGIGYGGISGLSGGYWSRTRILDRGRGQCWMTGFILCSLSGRHFDPLHLSSVCLSWPDAFGRPYLRSVPSALLCESVIGCLDMTQRREHGSSTEKLAAPGPHSHSTISI